MELVNLERRNQMVEDNIGLVYKISKEYTGKGLDVDDLIQEGAIGLMKAADNFDYDGDKKFASYACSCIRGAMADAIQKLGRTIYLPDNVFKDLAKINKARKEFFDEFGRDADNEELSEYMNIPSFTASKILELTVAAQNTVSYDTTLSDDEDSDSFIDTFGEEDEYDEPEEIKDYSSDVNNLMHQCLDARDADILYRVKAGYESLTEIGEDYGISKQAISQIAKKAEQKLKDYVSANNISDPRA